MKILLVEDERYLSAAVCRMLKQERFLPEAVYNGKDGLDYILHGTYDAVILDVMLPGMNGFDVLERIRQAGSSIPVLMLTARGDLEDRIRGLETGADYYLSKPFEKQELIACLRTITRRKADAFVQDPGFGDLQLLEKEACLNCPDSGQNVKLGAKEYQMMELFMHHPGQIFPKDKLLERIWGEESEAEYNTIEVYVSFLRKKLTFLGSNVKIVNVRGLGYYLESRA